ncbi:MAG: DNA mismatch repair endonuclease MutL [Phycisphaerales bacterium]|nr:DNA mismatch repair endonuclease MutL [Phycisphaerales bacterium]
MPEIRSLDPLLVNQIAAGEVVERPASVVKELVENSIDAGAHRIRIELEQGGIERIEIVDDGYGIHASQLPLAVAPHATSKLTRAEDLHAIATMGFRGEALAAITSVSRFSIISRAAGQPSGARLDGEGASLAPPAPCGCPPGTTIVVRNLFFNTPARRKFLRTVQTEFGHISDLVGRLAMSHPALGFVLVHDGRTVLDLPPQQSPRQRIIEVLGRELENELLEVSLDSAAVERPITVWGFVGTPSVARSSARFQHFFINGRFVRDKTIAHALKEGYRGLLDPTRLPLAVLYIEMDPALVDVNVHPTKAEVRFRETQSIHGLVLTAVRQRLLLADLTPDASVAPARPSFTWPGSEAPIVSTQPSAARAFVEHFKQLDPVQRGVAYQEIREALKEDGVDEPDIFAGAPASNGSASHTAVRILQVHSSYIVVEDAEGLSIIDQHALHERVMFEELKSRVLVGSLESQRLLMPAVVEVRAEQMDLLDTLAGLLEKIGVQAEPIGPRSIAVHAFPSFLFERRVDPVVFLTELFDRAAEDGFSPEDEAALHEVLDMMSCKAAVKAGDRLSEAELLELLRRREAIERGGSCPHGRPTTIRMTLRDLERQFGRR